MIKTKGLVDSARWFSVTVRLFSNWPQIYWQRFVSKAPVRRFKLRQGVTFFMTHKETMLPTVVDIWSKGMYGSLSEIASSKAPTVIDIGGHIGAFSLLVLFKIPDSRVIVYEPSHENFQCLEKNIASNGFQERCIAKEEAVGGTVGSRTLFISASSVNSSLVKPHEVVGKAEVPCTTLERMFLDLNIDTCDLLKIDCEGAEYEILMQSPVETLSKIKNIILEWHEVPGASIKDLAGFLTQCGYVVAWNTKSTMASEGFLTAHR